MKKRIKKTGSIHPATTVRQSSYEQNLIPDEDLFTKKKLSKKLSVYDFNEEVIVDQLEILTERIKQF